MRILMLSDEERAGGAAVAASRLADGLAEAGHQVFRIVFSAARETQHSWQTIPLTAQLSLTMRVASRLLGPGFRERRMHADTTRQLEAQLAAIKPDVINIHNLHGALHHWNIDFVQMCNAYAPSAWTLHDMWSFTGRCAHASDCRAFLDGCTASCPTPDEYPSLSPHLIAGAWARRKELLHNCSRLVAVCPSRWLAEEAGAGLWRGHKIAVIPNGIPLDTFHPLDRELARKALGVSAVGPVLIMSAQYFMDKNKGAHLLVEALRMLANKPVTLLTLGDGASLPEIRGVHWHHIGNVNHQRMVALAYCAADLMVHPSIADTLPNVVIESIACGTPVLGFKVGGVPEVVRPDVTGWLAPEMTAESFAGALDAAILQIRQGADLSTSCRATAENEYSRALQSNRYIELFESLSR